MITELKIVCIYTHTYAGHIIYVHIHVCEHIMRVCKELTFFAVCRHNKKASLGKTG